MDTAPKHFSTAIQLQRLYYPEFWPPLQSCCYLPDIAGISLSAGREYISNDFYNALFLDTYSISASEVELVLHYVSDGRVVVEIWHEMPSGACQRIHASIHPPCNCAEPERVKIVLPESLHSLSKGHIYCRISAVDAPCVISNLAWVGRKPVRRLPCLALIITHFHREKEVIKFVASLQGDGLSEMLAQSQLRLLIVDNSRSLPSLGEGLKGVCVIPNPNYGGSGGFARGILEAEKLSCTHCLLLDDDASLGGEGIRRIWASHAMAVKDTAISAILLETENPLSIIEAATIYTGLCKPIARGGNLLDFNSLKWLWNSPPHADYGAWCGFSFPLSSMRWYPFPFFVRGDDQLFSMLNQICIRTINGVTSRVPRFQRKDGPLQALLSTRSQMVINAVLLNTSSIMQALYYAKPALNELLTYRYGHCLARHYALKMYANSESAFTSDLDGAKALEKAQALACFWPLVNSWQSLVTSRTLRRKGSPNPIKDAIKRLIFIATLNGHLIPLAPLFQRHVYITNLDNRISFKDALLTSKIIYYDHLRLSDIDDKTRVCTFNQRVGLLCFWLVIVDIILLLLLGNAWSRKAKLTTKRLAQSDFWRSLYA